jgi:site-specific DNA-methyltransferase (adenine-specific)
MELMKQYPDKHFDLAIVDPPYNISSQQKRGVGSRIDKTGKMNNWNHKLPDKDYFDELFRVSKNQIIWGGNYFIEYLYPTKCFLIWDKKITDTHKLSMSEYAWTSFDSVSKTFYQPPCGERGFYSIDGKRIHPTQKSIDLYEWILSFYAKPNDLILDTHVGSASSLIACEDLGFKYIACELDKDYYNQSLDRLKKHCSQGKLFDATPKTIIEPLDLF